MATSDESSSVGASRAAFSSRRGQSARAEAATCHLLYDHGKFGCACGSLEGHACEFGHSKLLLNDGERVRPSFLTMAEKPLSTYGLARNGATKVEEKRFQICKQQRAMAPKEPATQTERGAKVKKRKCGITFSARTVTGGRRVPL
jgi:hypothetical protein